MIQGINTILCLQVVTDEITLQSHYYLIKSIKNMNISRDIDCCSDCYIMTWDSLRTSNGNCKANIVQDKKQVIRACNQNKKEY